MTTTIKITNPNAPATDPQKELLRHLARQFYTAEQVNTAVITATLTKGAASDMIDKLLTAGAIDSRPKRTTKPRRSTSRSATPMTDSDLEDEWSFNPRAAYQRNYGR